VRKLVAAMLGFAVGVVVAPATALAVQPEMGSFSDSDSGTDPAGTTCAFPVHFSQVESGRYAVFSNQAGDFVRLIVHIRYVATITANGHTLSERDTFTRTIYADDTMRDTGVTVHILGAHGLVMRDAGQIVYSDTNETVSYVHGPHPQLFGASFCADLA
jgi:hypothetical protein